MWYATGIDEKKPRRGAARRGVLLLALESENRGHRQADQEPSQAPENQGGVTHRR
jgi:hypothetical protein